MKTPKLQKSLTHVNDSTIRDLEATLKVGTDPDRIRFLRRLEKGCLEEGPGRRERQIQRYLKRTKKSFDREVRVRTLNPLFEPEPPSSWRDRAVLVFAHFWRKQKTCPECEDKHWLLVERYLGRGYGFGTLFVKCQFCFNFLDDKDAGRKAVSDLSLTVAEGK